MKLATTIVKIYFLGDEKTLDSRVPITDSAILLKCLTAVLDWRPESGKIVPEILFQRDSSPTTSPEREVRTVAAKPTSASSASRSGQTDMATNCQRRDQKMCVFCDADTYLTVGHLIQYKDKVSEGIEEILKSCKVGGVQEMSNGLTLCRDCHSQFDGGYVGLNPDTNRLEVSSALLESEHKYLAEKWKPLAEKLILPRSDVGSWPNYQTFARKYAFFQKKTEERKLSIFSVACEICGKMCVSEKGVAIHQRQGGCASNIARRKTVGDQRSPAKKANQSSSSSAVEDFDNNTIDSSHSAKKAKK